MVPPHPQASNADERDHYMLGKRILLQNESSGSCFPETSKALELHFSNYLEVVSDIGIEDTIVDNREDNGVDKNVLIEGNSTKVVLQGIRGDVTNEVDEEFSDPDYNLSDEDDDFQDVIDNQQVLTDDQQVLVDDQQVLVDDQQVLIDDQQVLIDDQQVKKLRGRPKNASVNVPVSSGILVPLQNADVESDYAYSDELPDDDVQSDKGENNGQKNNIYEEYDEGKNKNLPRFALGMKFKNFKQFKEACRELGIRKRRQLRFKPNDQQRVVCICKVDGCPFRIYASKVNKRDPTVQIKSLYLKHKGAKVFDNFHLSPKYIARKYLNIFKADPGWNISGIVEIVRKDFGYTIENLKAWRAKNQALKWIYGDEGLQYGKLLSYRAELLRSNPGSNVVIWRDGGKFLGFYVCLGALKEAFKSGCRPLISLDGCWLKGTYGGNLLSAVAIDPNDCIFPVAYAVIAEAESKETWSWFIDNLGYDLDIRNSHHIAFMSDRQKGLIRAVKDLFPEAEHRNCVRHMYQNFKQKHKGKALKDLVWNAARASNKLIFQKCMEELDQEDKAAREWFNNPEMPFQSWTRALFRTNTECDMLLNNLCESFNRYILDARDKAIITMLEMIKNKLMKRLYKKREWVAKSDSSICPKIVKKLNKISKEAIWFKTDYSGGPRVSVDGPGGVNIVDMKAKSCTCRRWELTGLPCPHAYACIIGNSERVEDYVDTFYTIETFKNVYSHYINPTNPEDHWPEVVDCGEVIPPKIVKKKRGRKPKSRKKEPGELEKKKKAEAVGKAEKRAEQKSEKRQPQKLSKKGSTQVMCSICKKYGHNARGHYKFVKAGESSSSHYLEAISPVEEASNDGDYLNMYRPEMWNHQGLNLAYQSTITQAPIEEQVIVVQTDVVAAQGVDEVAIKGIESTRLSHTSKRGRLFKRKVMKEYIVEVQKKKKKIVNHSKV
ncbi:hypothetical protein KY290_010235 [Solanum tuberosum]|uniref:SWIM-type domain-containing protein n=1 Tax=Solanum tuberosum TaxID=4113 RepID=A0ABQ7VZ74_SOLTU|nr:hypothetical protein KY289_010622 [Solanum tuberosum]KAH0773098.1 hypothetical protein KY290_010235 [Solanum tuberosum]